MYPLEAGTAVVPWSELRDWAPLAALLGEPVEEVRADLAALPAGIEGYALVRDGRPLAAGLLVLSNVEAERRGGLVRLSFEGGSLEAGMALVAFAEERLRQAGAREAEVVERHAPGAGSALAARGYRRFDAMLWMRCGQRHPPAPLPEGVRERGLEEVGVGAWVDLDAAAFESVPFNVAPSRDAAERQVAEPHFDPCLLRFLVDERGTVGYLQCRVDSTGSGEILSIGVREEARGRGLGRYLLRRGAELLDWRGAREVLLRVAESNRVALELYQREGYGVIARRVAWERTL